MRILIVHNNGVVNTPNLKGTTKQFGGFDKPMEVVPEIGSIIEYKKVVDGELYGKGLGGVEVTTYIVETVQYAIDEEESETVCMVHVGDELDYIEGQGKEVYRHYKGYLYEKIGETIVEEGSVETSKDDDGVHTQTLQVRHHESGYVQVTIEYKEGKLLYKSDEPYVLYRSMQGIMWGTVWAREVEDFYKVEDINGYKRKRFTKV